MIKGNSLGVFVKLSNKLVISFLMRICVTNICIALFRDEIDKFQIYQSELNSCFRDHCVKCKYYQKQFRQY